MKYSTDCSNEWKYPIKRRSDVPTENTENYPPIAPKGELEHTITKRNKTNTHVQRLSQRRGKKEKQNQ